MTRIQTGWVGFTLLLAPVACGARTSLEPGGPESGVVFPSSAESSPVVVLGPAGASNKAPVGASKPAQLTKESNDPLPSAAECAADNRGIYLVSNTWELLRFDPATGEPQSLGVADCGPDAGAPRSMALDRFGRALILANHGLFYRVSIQDAACRLVDSYSSGQYGYLSFDISYARSAGDGKDELFASDRLQGLARIEPDSNALSRVGYYSMPDLVNMALTASPEGDLYSCIGGQEYTSIAGVAKTSGVVANEEVMPVNLTWSALACAYWQGDFYVFTSGVQGGDTWVNRFRPSEHSVMELPSIAGSIVGASVSTCPQTGS
jgi:hypothetical protein